jgi:ABC-type amino acid transport substrate-binding protein
MTFTKKSVDLPIQDQIYRDLNFYSADSLPQIDEQEQLDDELIERTLQTSGIGMIFGESNTGKTFMAIHMGMCVATGMQFLGRNVNQCAVLYVAAESPAGVAMRARAWQKQYQLKADQFFICPDQINLYEDDVDTYSIYALALKIYTTRGIKIGLIIFDTLARISAGSNENSNDMGKVMGRCDELGDAFSSAIVVIHHSGKDSLKGARGWSGMKAHINTEIEVSQSNGISVAQITKQREIEGKGDRVAFTLEVVQVGINKWGNRRSTCWVNQTDVPTKTIALSKSKNEVLDAISETTYKSATRGELKEILKKDKDNINKTIREMLNDGLLYELGGKLFIKQIDIDDQPF